MSWNFRVVKADGLYSIHDVYYDDNQSIVNIGREAPVEGEDIEELKWALQKMLEACDKPVIDHDGEET